ncbi:hypothetical protein FQV37_2673 [Psychrobacter nivimaris]|uniref:Uncharacterized protein n=1 Tax=Psychrobacter nivimaris TaxID=281738 RepID=A0A6N7C2S1_9GAMM|nr:hypothetical protein FQV37_2673 [Psychrobacter nivimaris]
MGLSCNHALKTFIKCTIIKMSLDSCIRKMRLGILVAKTAQSLKTSGFQ